VSKVSAFLQDVLRGGLPDALDLGPNATGPGDPRTERSSPTNTAGVDSAVAPVPINWPLWIGVGVAGVVGLALLLKR